ncbi:hypothetical protein COP1_039634 [Malus domestica]
MVVDYLLLVIVLEVLTTIMAVNFLTMVVIIKEGTKAITSEAEAAADHIILALDFISLHPTQVLEFLVLQDHFNHIVLIILLRFQHAKFVTKKGMLQLIAFRDTVHRSQVLNLRFNAKFAGNLVILQFSAITEAILPIKASHHPQL